MKRYKYIGLCLVTAICASLSLSSVSSAMDSKVEVDSSQVEHQHSAQEGYCYEPVYHTHEGDASLGTICYQTPEYCGGTIKGSTKWVSCSRSSASHSKCSTCGQTQYEGAGNGGYHADLGHSVSFYRQSTTYTCSTCKKSASGSGTCTKIVGYTLSCGKDENTVDSYNLTCQKEGQVVGEVKLYKEIGSSYTLSVESDGVEIVSVIWNDGSTGSSVSVSSNGSYSCEVTVKDFAGCVYVKTLSYEVTDYDTQPPVFESISYSDSRCNYVPVEVIYEDNIGTTMYMIEK